MTIVAGQSSEVLACNHEGSMCGDCGAVAYFLWRFCVSRIRIYQWLSRGSYRICTRECACSFLSHILHPQFHADIGHRNIKRFNPDWCVYQDWQSHFLAYYVVKYFKSIVCP